MDASHVKQFLYHIETRWVDRTESNCHYCNLSILNYYDEKKQGDFSCNNLPAVHIDTTIRFFNWYDCLRYLPEVLIISLFMWEVIASLIIVEKSYRRFFKRDKFIVQRICIIFCLKIKISYIDALKMLRKCYGDEAMSKNSSLLVQRLMADLWLPPQLMEKTLSKSWILYWVIAD